MIVIAGSARLKPETLDELSAVASEMAAKSRAEEGCVEYRFSSDIDNPEVICLFEVWESTEALNSHFATEHFAAFGTSIADAFAAEPVFTRFEVSSSGPLFE